jgi:hypothetical protein
MRHRARPDRTRVSTSCSNSKGSMTAMGGPKRGCMRRRGLLGPSRRVKVGIRLSCLRAARRNRSVLCRAVRRGIVEGSYIYLVVHWRREHVAFNEIFLVRLFVFCAVPFCGMTLPCPHSCLECPPLLSLPQPGAHGQCPNSQTASTRPAAPHRLHPRHRLPTRAAWPQRRS